MDIFEIGEGKNKKTSTMTFHQPSTGCHVICGGGAIKTGELRYRPFGVTRFASGTTPTSVRFTGQREEAALGLYFYNARWYDPAPGVLPLAGQRRTGGGQCAGLPSLCVRALQSAQVHRPQRAHALLRLFYSRSLAFLLASFFMSRSRAEQPHGASLSDACRHGNFSEDPTLQRQLC